MQLYNVRGLSVWSNVPLELAWDGQFLSWVHEDLVDVKTNISRGQCLKVYHLSHYHERNHLGQANLILNMYQCSVVNRI
jgi:hypothetical protein